MLLGDVVIAMGAYSLAFVVRFGGFPQGNWNAFLRIAPIGIIGTILALFIYRGYTELHRQYIETAFACFLSALLGALAIAISAYFHVPSRIMPRSVIIGGWAIHFVLLAAWRRIFVGRAKAKYYSRTAVAVSGAGNSGESGASVSLPEFVRVVRNCSAQEILAGAVDADVLVVMPDVAPRDRRRLLSWAASRGADVILAPEVYDLIVNSARFLRIGDLPFLHARGLTLPAEVALIKRVLDIVVSSFLLAVFSPFFVLIPPLIWLTSPGPVFYRQKRVGQWGKMFEILKFRTMKPDAERETGPVLASKNDPRITTVGRFLRLTHLDELPQLFNVLRGDMSMVGPRPERPEFVEEFARMDPAYRLREVVKPGMAGMAQLLGRYETSPEDKLRFDLMYITRCSLWLDFQILFWTVQEILFPQKLAELVPAIAQKLDWKAPVSVSLEGQAKEEVSATVDGGDGHREDKPSKQAPVKSGE